MKLNWTIVVAAGALVFGSIPAFAFQASPAKSSDQKKTEKKIDAAAMTPFMTPHQGASLKKAVDGGEKMKVDEQVAYPGENPAAPASSPGNGQEPLANDSNRTLDPVSHGKEEVKQEPPKPSFRLMGTACGSGDDFAVFEVGKDWPSMLKAGDKLEDGTLIVSVSRGKVVMERIIMAAQPAFPGQEATEGHPGIAARPSLPEKRERFELYAW